ncbi:MULTISPECIES: ATP-dependent acyl-CoA ligase [unclassified Beijerinckia]|uniref:ATP-dependent acyl-CoA ligase n=1 Tax=unclassified Beijerinckia TaxID=2638183 RepID=UPI00089D7F73|nr:MULTISPECIES: ATP-dependent acyl-CoA ligase [unclassified Beijerinckia]MDH7797584.1 crotonobetaine/carnitine-CoA ligase [Beijerinckia sp. GAS462]SEC91416.1 crotonobetaine/carnitine-CoA ligase [Beijerinckia sp. 28-YEA-48]
MDPVARASSDVGTSGDRFQDIVAQFAPSERVLTTILTRQAARYGDRILLVAGNVQWTYAQTAEVAAASAQSLAAVGIAPGDRVAILASNRAEFLEIYLGCAWLGAVAVPINPALRGPQLQHIFRNSGPKLLVVEEIYRPNLEAVSEAGLLPELLWTIDATGLERGAGTQQKVELPLPRPGDTVAVLYTSGTTGPAKGVCCPQAQLFWWGIYSARALGIREGDVLLTTLPIFHTNALNAFYQALLNGCTYVLEPKFSASGFWPAVRKHHATVTYLLGAMAAILLAQPENADDANHSVRVALGGGVPARFHDLFRQRFGVPLVDGYGSTETNFVFASPIPSDRPGSMGYLVEGMEARIVDADDAPVADGEAGELILRAREPFAFATGYFGMSEKTVEAWRNLWFHSGDRVVRHVSGHYYFIDRMKDAIRRRGENVSSWEVEDVIHVHPAVAACAVYPVPSELGEDEVAVAVQRKAGVDLLPLDLIKYCEGRMAYFAVPRFVRFVDEMPLTENGKIKKVSLREAGLTADMWDRESTGYKLRR